MGDEREPEEQVDRERPRWAEYSFASGSGRVPVDAARNRAIGTALGLEGWCFADLFEPSRLRELDEIFRLRLASRAPALSQDFEHYRRHEGDESAPAVSSLLIAVGRHLSWFVAGLLDGEDGRVEDARQSFLAEAHDEADVFRFRTFIQRRAIKRFTQSTVAAWASTGLDMAGLERHLRELVEILWGPEVKVHDPELTLGRCLAVLLELEASLQVLLEGRGEAREGEALAMQVGHLLERLLRASRTVEWLGAALFSMSEIDAADTTVAAQTRRLAFVRALIEVFERWASWRRFDEQAQAAVSAWPSFRFPHTVDPDHLVPLRRPTKNEHVLAGTQTRRRDGFALTDARHSRRQVAAEVEYCLYCHDREKDSCAHGLRDKAGVVKENALGIPLAGCPLEERISEMHVLRKEGDVLGALALVCIDNPMVPGTGHRICNDCMKACVFQKQDPVDIPQAETGVLTDVLALPWGTEIYSLLTRFNPLNRRRPFPLPYNGKNVLVVGMGPAGYTLAHHLLNEGFGVVGVDGLKIEPLPAAWLGADVWPPLALESWADLREPLERRVLAGFGGVAEYGITVRWDKSFLTLLYLTLARRRTFRLHGGVRFGGTMTADETFALGFHHVALAAGAGKPTIIDLENNLIRGVRKASDFLMALQLTGAFRHDTMASLQVRLPALVIGGGLTAIDTATEVAAYYPHQVEAFLERWESLGAGDGRNEEDRLAAAFDGEEAEIAREFLAHGRAVRDERARARGVPGGKERPDLAKLVAAWGGVAIAYRRALQESPAYRLNHEEVAKALEEGIRVIELVSPKACVPDKHGALSAVTFERWELVEGVAVSTGDVMSLPARALFVAAGTSPNVTYEREHPGTFALDGKGRAFRGFVADKVEAGSEGEGGVVARWALRDARDNETGFFTSYAKDGRFVTYFGDNLPAYAGSVVKAMASAKDGYPRIAALFADEIAALAPAGQPARDEAWLAFAAELDESWRATVVQVERLTPTIVEVIVRAPAAARHFRPGQFFRLQNFERWARQAGPRRLVMEGLALTGAWVDVEQGLLSLIVLELGASSRLCAHLVPGEPVVLMGPTGAPTEIPRGEDVVLCGGGLGNAVLFSIARALKDNGCRVVYFAGYKRASDIFKAEEIERATDQVVWSVDAGEPLPPRRPQDRSFLGNIVDAMAAYARGDLGEPLVPLRGCTRLITIGSDKMMAAVKRARRTVLSEALAPGHVAIASINSPMQCMMKAICAQCLQRQVDPITGAPAEIVFSCFNQDQLQDSVDWENLASRLRQNTVQEKLADAWVRRLPADLDEDGRTLPGLDAEGSREPSMG